MSKEIREQIDKIRNWKPILNEEKSIDLKQSSEISKKIREKKCQWDVQQPGIKIFFDVTSFNHELQTFFGKVIILGNIMSQALKGRFKNTAAAANHVGFIFSDGSIFHATNDSVGVQFVNNYQSIREYPDTYILINIGGDESLVKAKCQEIIQKIEHSKKEYNKSKSTYDMMGIIRQIPIIGKILSKEIDNYSFFCSELVANVLVRAKVISYEELKVRKITEEGMSGLDISDEISPTDLYEMLVPVASNVPLVCEY